ncbi:hypothetical protein [Aestuariibius sp. HNIBRBA575]|uniref:hypothetical protein n=1 Tax=Aestuariibius sp. HNIBRBA575 TaxID=3233343 RepID=UPI0034A2749A
MQKHGGAGIRPVVKRAHTLLVGALVILMLMGPGSATLAVAQQSYPANALVVGNDRGGFIRQRMRELRNIRASGQPVEIRGQVCYSTCTMYLGLPDTCVSRATTFGFHGPSIYGTPMNAADFERVSRIISNYYPAPLRDWYMSEGRYRINGVHRISASQIINMGVREC